MDETSSSPQETKQLASQLAKSLKHGALITLQGEMGAGKTTFTQGFGEALGITRMVSPTYTLIKEYPLRQPFNRLIHVDLYRLSTPEEALDLGLDELWSDPDNVLLIEWPEKIKDILPADHLEVKIEKKADDHRLITINQ